MIDEITPNCDTDCFRSRCRAEIDRLLVDAPPGSPEQRKLFALSLDNAMQPCSQFCDRHDKNKETTACK